MPKTKISEFSSTPANNTDIDSINIAEGCAPSGINDAIRELMAQLKDFQTGAVGDSFNGPINGTVGATTPAAGAFTSLTASTTLGVTGVSTLTGGAVVQGLTVGRGLGAVATNTAVGASALNANTTGSTNVAIGNLAGFTNQTGATNTYVGNRAGVSATGSFNTFVGSGGTDGAGAAITSGAKNTIIGGYSGNQDSLDIRTASNYVVLSDGDGARQITMKEGQTLALDSAVPNAGTGITFPATQSASTDANTLDDYEEGTWTPVIVGSSTAGTATYSNQVGRYTRIGRMVQFECAVEYSAGTGTGNLRVSGLPFSCQGNSFPPTTCNLESITLSANNYASPYVQSGDTYILMSQNPTGGGSRTAIAYDAAGGILVAGTYSTS